jgi:hypothetical protein|tara:strand:- start:87 stop:338 length:252 start_codon:yes stop_codon:yes gene_type:complete
MVLEIILGLFVLTEAYIIWNLMKKTELLETWVEGFTQMVETVQQELREIDSRGSFESDDETGAIYKQIKDTVNQLESYKGEEQ